MPSTYAKRLVHVVLVAVAAAPLLGATAAPAQDAAAGGDARGGRNVQIVATGHSSFVESSNQSCPAPATGETLVTLRVGAVFGDARGDTLVGSQVSQPCLYVRVDGSAHGFGTGEFTGTIVGCGSGTVSLWFTATISAPDPVTGERTSRDDVWVLPHSGTEGLATVRHGRWVTSGTVQPDLSLSGGAAGQVRC